MSPLRHFYQKTTDSRTPQDISIFQRICNQGRRSSRVFSRIRPIRQPKIESPLEEQNSPSIGPNPFMPSLCFGSGESERYSGSVESHFPQPGADSGSVWRIEPYTAFPSLGEAIHRLFDVMLRRGPRTGRRGRARVKIEIPQPAYDLERGKPRIGLHRRRMMATYTAFSSKLFNHIYALSLMKPDVKRAEISPVKSGAIPPAHETREAHVTDGVVFVGRSRFHLARRFHDSFVRHFTQSAERIQPIDRVGSQNRGVSETGRRERSIRTPNGIAFVVRSTIQYKKYQKCFTIASDCFTIASDHDSCPLARLRNGANRAGFLLEAA